MCGRRSKDCCRIRPIIHLAVIGDANLIDSVFRGILIRLVTGSSWRDIESILYHEVSDTTLRTRRDEWIAAGVFGLLCREAIDAFDRIIGLDLTEVAIDGLQQKAPTVVNSLGEVAELSQAEIPRYFARRSRISRSRSRSRLARATKSSSARTHSISAASESMIS